jgi:hypothetical protein
LPIIAAEIAWWTMDREPHRAVEPPPSSHSREENRSGRVETDDRSLVHRFTRSRDGNAERIIGEANVRFAADEQNAILHLIFAPPLAAVPTVSVQSLDENISVKSTECRPYGARIEARRGRSSAEPLTVRIRYEVQG